MDRDTKDLDRVFAQMRTGMLSATRENLKNLLDQVEQSYGIKRQ